MRRRLRLSEPIDLAASARPLAAGWGDPTQRGDAHHWIRATRTPEGPATLEALAGSREVALRAFGPGAARVLDEAPAWLGLEREAPDPSRLPPPVRRCARAASGLRLPRVGSWFEPLTLLVLQQKVAGKEAARSFRALVRATSEPAPGGVAGLWLPPDPARVARLPGWSFDPLGVAPRQGRTLRAVAAAAARIEGWRAGPREAAIERLRSLPGIGPWTISSLLLFAEGDPDAVPVGDLHLPSVVAWNLAGERRARDARMLELLAPYRGLRGWVVRWIEEAGSMPPRRAPRPPLRTLPPGHERALSRLRHSLRD